MGVTQPAVFADAHAPAFFLELIVALFLRLPRFEASGRVLMNFGQASVLCNFLLEAIRIRFLFGLRSYHKWDADHKKSQQPVQHDVLGQCQPCDSVCATSRRYARHAGTIAATKPTTTAAPATRASAGTNVNPLIAGCR